MVHYSYFGLFDWLVYAAGFAFMIYYAFFDSDTKDNPVKGLPVLGALLILILSVELGAQSAYQQEQLNLIKAELGIETEE